jgi:metal-dependent amidase/aminoacylase/carboxypeptidase family protein
VPERTEASYFLRAETMADLDDLRQRARACLEGAAHATGTTVDIRVEGHVFEPVDAHPGLVATFRAACAAIGRPETLDPNGVEEGGSTDFGNVSQLVPGVHACLAVHSWPVVNHQHEFAAACVGPEGDSTVIDGAKVLALTAIAVAKNPSLLRR